MKKKISILIVTILLMTGCTCQYNLKIEDGVYKETIILSGSKDLNREWKIPVDKDIYNSGDDATDYATLGDLYKYKYDGNYLTFTNDFTRKTYMSSTAASLCFNRITSTGLSDQTIISTSNGTTCFDNYPNLDKVVINITVDKKVVSNNADSVNGNTYTWNLTKSNAKDKSINISFVNKDEEEVATDYDNNKYAIYIFFGILLLVVFVVYLVIKNLKNNGDKMDD